MTIKMTVTHLRVFLVNKPHERGTYFDSDDNELKAY